MKKSLKLISIILLGLVLVNTSILTLVKVHYELNKDYITKNYCVNTARPELHCNGQCHLESSLASFEKKETSESDAPTQNLNLISIEYFSIVNTFDFLHFKNTSTLSQSFEYNFYKECHSAPSDHPPIV